MRFTTLVPFLLAVPATVLACEGDCIVAITNAFLGNYTDPMNAVMSSMAQQFDDLIPSHPGKQAALSYLQPILSAYKKEAYQGMETAIFPDFFHGKCLDPQGNEPDGCPNPDCPIVCGTPGSMVHFYPKLRFIAYNETYHHLQRLCTPGTDAYNRVEQAVLDAAGYGDHDDRRRSSSRVYPRLLSDAVNVAHNNKNSGSGSKSGSGSGSGRDSVPVSRPKQLAKSSSASQKMVVPIFLKRDEESIKSGVRNVMNQAHGLLANACGGDGVEETNGLPKCSWEAQMKEYILSFP